MATTPEQEHYEELIGIAAEVAEAEEALEQARETAKARKAVVDQLNARWLAIATAGPDWQTKLDFGDE